MNRIYKPTGKKSSPGLSCRQLKKINPDLTNGEYWIDPNEGSADDAILVFCNFDTEESCISANPNNFNKARWTKTTGDGQYFMEEINNGKKFLYKTDSQQLRYLQLQSTAARQTVTYNCLNSSPYGARFSTNTGEEIDTVETRYKRNTFIEVADDCRKDNEWHTATISIRTNRSDILPLTDMLLFDIGQENQQFAIEVGSVCFS